MGKTWQGYVASVVGAIVGTLLGVVVAFAAVMSSFTSGLPELSTSDVVFRTIVPMLALSVLGSYTALHISGVPGAVLTSWAVAILDVVGLTFAVARSQWVLVLPTFALISPLVACAVVDVLEREA